MRYAIEAPCKLKKCPWCKKRPKLFKDELWNGNHGYHGNYDYYVQCINQDCKVNPKTHRYDDIYTSGDSMKPIKNACDDWNNRGDNNEKKQTAEVQN